MNYGSCWFFFDSEYLRYLQNELTRTSRINLDWLYQFIKDDKVKVFTIGYEGIITEISQNDFNFLTGVSRTCYVGQDKDFRILDKNKFKIILNVLKGYDFTSDEIFQFREDFSKTNEQNFIQWLVRKGCAKRKNLFGTILKGAGNLEIINLVFDCADDGTKLTNHNKYLFSTLGLFKVKGQAKSGMTCFADKFEIGDFFPGYVRNKNTWEVLRENYVSLETLKKITSRKIDVKDVTNQENEIKHKKKEKIRVILFKENHFRDGEINKFRVEFEKDKNSGGIFWNWLQKANRTERQKHFGQILQFTTNTHLVDDFLKEKKKLKISTD